jgi:hypothetical protein
LEEIAWSGFAEFARQWLLLGRRSEYEDGSGFHDLWLRAGGSAGHNGLWGVDVFEGVRTDPDGRRWEVNVHPGREIIQQAKSDRTARKSEKQKAEDDAGQKTVIEAMSGLPKMAAVFPSKLYTLTGIGERRLGRLLQQLVEQGIVEHCKAKRSPTHKKERDGAFRLTEEWYED